MADKLTATELTEARELAAWAGRRIPNGPTSGALMHGYNIGGTADLDAAIAMIVRRAVEQKAQHDG